MALTIYTKTGCPYCQAAMESFAKKNIEYTEINLSDNPGRTSEAVKIAGIRKVPIIVDNGKVTVGFNGGG